MASINSDERVTSASVAHYYHTGGRNITTVGAIGVMGSVRPEPETLAGMSYEELVHIASDLLNATRTCSHDNAGVLSSDRTNTAGSREPGKLTEASVSSVSTDHRISFTSAAGIPCLSQPKYNQMSTSSLTKMNETALYCREEVLSPYDNRVHRFHHSSTSSGLSGNVDASLVFHQNQRRMVKAEELLNHVGTSRIVSVSGPSNNVNSFRRNYGDGKMERHELYPLSSNRFGMMNLAKRQRYQQQELEGCAIENEDLNAAAIAWAHRRQRYRDLQLESSAMKRYQDMNRYSALVSADQERRLQCLREEFRSASAKQFNDTRMMHSSVQLIDVERRCWKQQLASPREQQVKCRDERSKQHCDREQAKHSSEHTSEEEKSTSSSARKARRPSKMCENDQEDEFFSCLLERNKAFLSREDNWEIRFQQLVQFKNKTGDCFVPKQYAPNKSLGYWVHAQRKRFRNRELSKDCIDRLDALGFCWNPAYRKVTDTV